MIGLISLIGTIAKAVTYAMKAVRYAVMAVSVFF